MVPLVHPWTRESVVNRLSSRPSRDDDCCKGPLSLSVSALQWEKLRWRENSSKIARVEKAEVEIE